MLQHSETTGVVWLVWLSPQQGEAMAVFIHRRRRPIQNRLRQWQQVRTWARLIREAEALWHVDVRALRRMGAEELSQLLEEVPPAQRRRINRWLDGYCVATRFRQE